MPAEPGHLPSNVELAQVIQMIADYLALDGQSTYRILAYEKAAALFRDHPVSVAEMALQGELRRLPGVGEAIERKVLEYVATGDIAFLARLRERYPEGLLTVMRLPGMGPKKTRLVWEGAGVADLRDLEKAARDGRLRGIAGMGEKTEANILRAIESWTAAVAGQDRGRRLRAVVEPQARRFVDALRALPEVVAADYAGSLRRCRATVRDIDLVVASTDPGAVMAAFATLPELARVEAQGETKLAAATYSGLGVDLRVVPPESYGNLLQHFTGSADHNVALRGYAQRRGYKISEYCVEHLESGRLIRCATEAEVYETVGLRYIPARIARGPGGDPGGRSRIAPGPGRSPRSAGRPSRPLRLDRRPGDFGADGDRRPGEGPRLPLLLRPLAIVGHDRRPGTRAADGPAGRDPRPGRTHRRDPPPIRHRGGHPGRRPARPAG